jgi:DNA-binding beta-propeller fold protein YncE
MKHSLAIALIFGGIAFAQEGQYLSLTGRIDLPNVNGRIDHFSADVKGKRVFMSALGNNTLEVLDVDSNKRLRTIGDLAEPQGAYYDPSTNRLFVANAKDGSVKVFDAATFHLESTVNLGDDADNVRYDSRGQRVIVGYGGGALAFLGPAGKKAGEISLEGHPESFQLEKTGMRLFVNVPGKREIQVADAVKNTLLDKWPVTSARSNFPMALDEGHRRLLIGCRSPARLLAIDTENGKETASAEIVGDTDDLFYDAAKSRVYVIGGQGFVDVFEQKGADGYARIAHIPTAAGARTGLFVPEWSKLFVAVPHRGDQKAEVIVFQTK